MYLSWWVENVGVGLSVLEGRLVKLQHLSILSPSCSHPILSIFTLPNPLLHSGSVIVGRWIKVRSVWLYVRISNCPPSPFHVSSLFTFLSSPPLPFQALFFMVWLGVWVGVCGCRFGCVGTMTCQTVQHLLILSPCSLPTLSIFTLLNPLLHTVGVSVGRWI